MSKTETRNEEERKSKKKKARESAGEVASSRIDQPCYATELTTAHNCPV